MSNAGPPANGISQSAKTTNDTSRQPLIPESFIDFPSQRLYILSIGLLCQAIKTFDWLHNLIFSDRSTNLTLKWILVDTIYCLVLKRLRIPRLNYATAAVLLQIFSLCFIDGILFGTVRVGVSSYSLTRTARDIYRKELSTSGRVISLRDLFVGEQHLQGEHTVKMSPISTARLNPGDLSFCLGPPSNTVLIPILLNNTDPSHIRYTISQVGSDKYEAVDLNAKEIRAIESQRLEALQVTRNAASNNEDEYNEADWDEEDEDEEAQSGPELLLPPGTASLERTQSVAHIKVTKPGVIKLQRVLDSTTSNVARIAPVEVKVVPCPQAVILPDKISSGDNIRCMGTREELTVRVSGVPPLSLKWFREINGRREHLSVDKIDSPSDKRGQAHEIRVPLDMPLNTAGSHIYVLDSLVDGLGNTRILTQSSTTRKIDSAGSTALSSIDAKRSVTVLRRASISFRDCGPGSPSSLLIGAKTPLKLAVKESDQLDGPWDVTVNYQPPAISASDKKAVKPWKKTFTTEKGETSLTIDAGAAGDYSILSFHGQHCPGDVLYPETCRVIEEPLPTAEIEWKRIHECSGDTGVSAYLALHGRPPFQVFYQQRRDDEPVKEMSRTFQGSRGDITLQPDRSGNYTYNFVYLSDANYKRIKLDGPSITQIVHPLASASFTGGAGNKKSINSCSGKVVDVEVDLRGDGPWDLEIQVVGPKKAELLKMKGLKRNREKVQVPIPDIIDQEGGTFQIDLVSIQDSYGCKKDLAVPGMSVNVRRVKPSVRFYAKDGKRSVTVLEDQEALLPLRLTGEGPWKITYQRSNPSDSARTAVLHSANDFLSVRSNGIYRLIQVSDSQCPGLVTQSDAEYTVDWIPRPVVKLSPETAVKYEKHNGSFIRSPTCEGNIDHVDLEITGRPPFQIGYNVARGEVEGIRILDQPVISSVQSRARLQLLTSQAGRVYYEVKQVGDGNYPLIHNKHRVIPRNERLLFEQEILARPSAWFKTLARLTHCLRDAFVPSESFSNDDMIILEGRPPFYLELSIKNLAASEVHRQTIEISSYQWRINLPNYIFTSVGPHLVTIESIRDASSCEQAALDPLKSSIWVDVAESAAIVPFDRREHFCVGELTQFQLEGIPPWTISYKVNRKHHEQIAKQSPFTLVQQHPGDFSILSISQQNKMCRAVVDNINFQVHGLPSAKVAHGHDFYENIHEGSQAQIVFTLMGEPPFTFTYQRSEAPTRKGAKPGKVLETHTVSGVMSHEYSIYSALEGTWTVTFISDKYCRYPPVQTGGPTEK